MPERLRELWNRIKEWWSRFTTRQKGIIIGLAVMTVIIFVVIIVIVSKPQYTKLITAETSAKAAEVTAVLDENNIKYRTSQDALRIEVENSQYSQAVLALGSSGFVPDDFSLNDVFTGSLSATTGEQNKRYQLYLEKKMSAVLTAIEGIDEVYVNFTIPEQTGTLIAQQEEASAYIQLVKTDGSITESKAANLARAIAAFLRNDDLSHITILGEDGELLFAGADAGSITGAASSVTELQSQAQTVLNSQVKRMLFGTAQFNNIEVVSNLQVDFASYEKAIKQYTPNDGRAEGMLSHKETYENESTSGIGGVPGTDSNGEGTTYVTSDYDQSSSTTTETEEDYLPNEYTEYATIAAGSIKKESSSMAITAIHYTYIKEEDVERQGLLDGGLTWEDYQLANSDTVRMEVDSDLIRAAAMASGIPQENIQIVAYTSPIFVDKESLQINWTTVLSAVLLLLILGLLVFVVLRSMGSKKEEEEEQTAEVNLDDLMKSNPEPTIEDIDVETKSETRKMIEKFVDDNPEAAAALLRNWLQDEW